MEHRLYLLDTNTVTYLVTDRSSGVREHYLELEGSDTLVISAITEGEIRFGLAKNSASKALKRNLSEFLSGIDILPWTSDVAKLYGTLRAQIEASGRIPGPLDLMIAGHAYALGATLVTHDKALKQLTAFLPVEDWYEPQQER